MTLKYRSDGKNTSRDVFVLPWIKNISINTVGLEFKSLIACSKLLLQFHFEESLKIIFAPVRYSRFHTN